MTLKEVFLSIAEEKNIPCAELALEPQAPNQLCIILNGENGNFEGHGIFLEDENLFVFYVPLGVVVPKEKQEQISLYLMGLNYRLKTAHIFFDEETRSLTARASQYMAGADWEKKDLMEQLIGGCGKTADYYYPEIMKKLFG